VTAASGLVGQVTSVTRYPTLSPNQQLRELSRQRRFRRMRRVVIASADASRVAAEQGGHRLRAVFVTLTYQTADGWCSRDVTGYVRRVREWLRRRGVAARYQWVIELQKSGRPHYHVVWWLPIRMKLPKPDSCGHWEKGASNIKAATRPVGYLVKYVSKGTDGDLPSGARLFGTGSPDAGVRLATHRAGLPMWLSGSTPSDVRCSRVARVGWVERETGCIHQSPYEFKWGRDAWGFVVITITQRFA